MADSNYCTKQLPLKKLFKITSISYSVEGFVCVEKEQQNRDLEASPYSQDELKVVQFSKPQVISCSYFCLIILKLKSTFPMT